MIKKLPKQKLLATLIACTALAACDAEFDSPVDPNSSSYNKGSLDLSKFVTVGDSLTAGYADGTLYLHGQENSYPAILATQFKSVGGAATFTQPLVDDDVGGMLFAGTPNADFPPRLVLNAAGESPSPEPIAGTITTDPFLNAATANAPYNNMGVPGAKSFHLGLAGYGDPAGIGTTSNPYYVRFASSTTSKVIEDAAGQLPTFFVLWIGNNDVLSYATSGGTGQDQTGNPNPLTYGTEDITDPTYFAGVYAQLVAAMTAAGGKGVLVNIPDVASIPFFTTVPHNPVPLDSGTASMLNSAYAAYNTGIQGALQAQLINETEAAARTISFSAGEGNAVVILDESLTDLTGLNAAMVNLRQATADDLIVLTASSKIGTPSVPNNYSTIWGLGTPLTDADVLVPSEIDAINTARTAYNATIKAAADANDNLAFLDVASLMSTLRASGIDYGTGAITSEYATGGGFSLDGVHPTARGYAVVANAMIDSINSAFSANIPKTDPSAYTTIFLK